MIVLSSQPFWTGSQIKGNVCIYAYGCQQDAVLWSEEKDMKMAKGK